MLESTTNGALCLKQSCVNELYIREELMGSPEGLQSNQSRRTTSNDGDAHLVIPQVRLADFGLVELETRNKKGKTV